MVEFRVQRLDVAVDFRKIRQPVSGRIEIAFEDDLYGERMTMHSRIRMTGRHVDRQMMRSFEGEFLEDFDHAVHPNKTSRRSCARLADYVSAAEDWAPVVKESLTTIANWRKSRRNRGR